MIERVRPRLELRGSSYYALWFSPRDNRILRKSMRTRDLPTASQRFVEFLREDTEETSPRVADVLDGYQRDRVDAAESDLVDRARRRRLITILRTHLADIRVAALNKSVIDGYVRARLTGSNPVQPGTIRLELGALVAAINHARKCGRMGAADVPVIEMPAAPSGRARWLSHEEFGRLLEVADEWTRWWLQIAYWTGARKKAIETLQWRQIDLPNGCIHLNPDGRGQTRKRRPTIPIVGELRELLEYLGPDHDGDSYVFGEGFEVRRGFERACRQADLGDVTPHTIRHTRATHLLQAGVDIWAVAGLLGDSITTVQRIYGHHCLGHLAAALENKN